MKKISFLTSLLLFSLLLGVGNLKAQVSIGADEAPQPFSVLEMFSEYAEGIYGGLRLPQLNTAQRDALDIETLNDPKSCGLMIYNTDINCVEYWNNKVWISMCEITLPCLDAEIAGYYPPSRTATVINNAPTQITVIPNGNPGDFTYQWERPGEMAIWTPIPGAIAQTHMATGGGEYRCIVTPKCIGGAPVTSLSFTVSSLFITLVVTSSEKDQTVCWGYPINRIAFNTNAPYASVHGLPYGLESEVNIGEFETVVITGTPVYAGTSEYNIQIGDGTVTGAGLYGTITVVPPPDAPGNMTGSPTFCPGTPQTYSIDPVPGAYGYSWTYPAGWSGPTTGLSVTLTPGPSAENGNIIVTANNGCGNSLPNFTTVNLQANLPTPGPITGSTLVCWSFTETYSIDPVPGATSYTWTFPEFWSAPVTTTDPTVTVTVDNPNFPDPITPSGEISVYASATCASSEPSTLEVTVVGPPSTQVGTRTCTGNYSITLNSPTPLLVSPYYKWEYQLPGGEWVTAPGVSNEVTYTATNVLESRSYRRTSYTECGEVLSNITAMNYVRPPLPVWHPYNLGANPLYDTPLKQMQYLANHPNDPSDGNIFGGLYQWGRKPVDYAIDPSTYTRYQGNTDPLDVINHSANLNDPSANPVYNSSGQITEIGGANADLFHILSTTNDWRQNNTYNSLWGNGSPINMMTAGGIWSDYDNRFYQRPVKTENDPCPDGWRVPTQNDWELMLNYDCRPDLAATSIDRFVAGGLPYYHTNNGLTVTTVRCNGGTCKMTRGSNANGLAFYETETWNSSFDGDTDMLEVGIEPILFLPNTGYRNPSDGDILMFAGNGYYWSSTRAAASNSFYFLYFEERYIGSEQTYPVARGLAIRCVSTAND